MPIIYNMLCWKPSVRNYFDIRHYYFVQYQRISFDRFYDELTSMYTFRDFG